MRFPPLPSTLAAVILAALDLSACSPAAQLECPTAELRTADGVLVDTKADMAAYGARFQSGYAGNALPEAVAAVRAQYPAATPDEIQNFLVAAYCPVARQAGGDTATQKASLKKFEAALSAILQP